MSNQTSVVPELIVTLEIGVESYSTPAVIPPALQAIPASELFHVEPDCDHALVSNLCTLKVIVPAGEDSTCRLSEAE